MRFIQKISYETKVEAIRRIEKGEAIINSTAHKLGVDNKTVREWIMKYESQGIESLRKSEKKKR